MENIHKLHDEACFGFVRHKSLSAPRYPFNGQIKISYAIEF